MTVETKVFDPALETLRLNELAYIGPNGVEVWSFGNQPSTEDIAERHRRSATSHWTHVVQRLGDSYEVYALSSLRHHMGTWTIGLPIHVGTDLDAAVMVAALSV